jgi:hypothetical protein
MWAMVSHIKPDTDRKLSKNIISQVIRAIREWMESIGFNSPEQVPFLVRHEVKYVVVE